jgi:hypothetical protein
MRILAMWAFSVKPELERQAHIFLPTRLAIDSQLFSRKCCLSLRPTNTDFAQATGKLLPAS